VGGRAGGTTEILDQATVNNVLNKGKKILGDEYEKNTSKFEKESQNLAIGRFDEGDNM